MSGLKHVLAWVAATPWAILDTKFAQIMGVLELHAAGGKLTPEQIRAAIGDAERPQPTVGRGVAVLPLYGLLLPRATAIDESSGIQGLNRFGAAFDALVRDDAVSAIVLDVDSPGGAVSGVAEVATKIFNARGTKPIVAVANTQAASAAYWIAAAADEVVISPSAEVGSIGVMVVHLEVSKAAEKNGLTHTVLKYGKNKGEGNPFEPLSEEAQAALQQRVNEFGGMFERAIAKYRGVSVGDVRSKFGQGRVFGASKAIELGMADRQATLDETIARLGGRRSQAGRLPRASSPSLQLAAVVVDGDQYDRAVAAVRTALAAPAGAALVGWFEAGEFITADEVNESTIEAGLDGAAPVLDPTPVQDTAPEAKEIPMAAPVAPAPSTAADQELERMRAELKRRDDLGALKKSEPNYSAQIDAAITDGRGLQAVKDEIMADMRAKLAAKPDLKTPRASGVEENAAKRPWSGFGEFLGAVIGAANPNVPEPDLRLFAGPTGMSQAVPADGGFLVPPQFSQLIWDGLNADPNNLLAMTDNYTVEGESLTFNANAETSRATGSRWGGVQAYWINEADQITKSKPKFRQVRVEPQQLAVLIYLTDKLLNNSPTALEQYVSRAAIEEIGFLAGDAIVNGTGAGQPKGIMASGCLVTVNKESSQANTTVLKANINKMWARLHPRSRANAVWLCNVDVEPQFDDFNTPVKNVAGTENVGGFGTQVYNGEKNTLKGRPIVFTEFNATLGTTGDIILADMKGYLSGTRGAGIQSAMSIHTRFEYLEQAFRFVFEVDGQPWLASALTPYKGSNTLTTFVALQTR